MTDLEFIDRAEALLQAVETVCDRINETTDVDLDVQRSGGVMTLTFANRSQIVVNFQKPLHEIWLAARSGGYHYRWVEADWQDTKDGLPFFARLTEAASQQAGQALQFTAQG